jgi:hypothetical protein
MRLTIPRPSKIRVNNTVFGEEESKGKNGRLKLLDRRTYEVIREVGEVSMRKTGLERLEVGISEIPSRY